MFEDEYGYNNKPIDMLLHRSVKFLVAEQLYKHRCVCVRPCVGPSVPDFVPDLLLNSPNLY